MDTKICTLCKKDLPIEKFAIKRSKKDGRQSRCRECHSKYTRNHYQENKEYYKDKAHNHIKKMVEMVRKLKAEPCSDCGKKYPWYVMDFDHLKDKELDISKMVRRGVSEEKIKLELKKCEIVCSNCHRERTYKRNQSLLDF